MLNTRPLVIMLRALGYAAIPAWPLALAAALLWSGRVELLLLAVATTGAHGALTLALIRAARERTRLYEELMARRDAQYERLERMLVGAVADLHPRADAAMTRPDLLRLVP